jgi:predicted nuclease with TOPRIM domain
VKRALLVSAVGVGLAFAGCGQSDEDQAKDDVCDARVDIQKNVTKLQNLTLGTATVDQVKSDLNAIKDDLKKMSDAQGQLDETRKQQVEKANQTFKSQLDTLTEDLGSSQSLQDAAQQLKTDIADLANADKQAFAPIDCG